MMLHFERIVQNEWPLHMDTEKWIYSVHMLLNMCE